jgi:hypothetical protein
LPGHACKAQGGSCVLEAVELGHRGFLLLTQASSSASEGSARRMWLRWACLSRTGGGCLCGVLSC